MSAPGTFWNPQNPYKSVAGPTWAGGPTNAIASLNSAWQSNTHPQRLRMPGSGAGAATVMNTGVPTTAYGSPEGFHAGADNFSAHYARSGGLAAQALGGGGMGGGGGGGGPSFNTTPKDLEEQAQRSAQRIGYRNNQLSGPSRNANPNMGSAQNWHDLNQGNPNIPAPFGPAGQGPGNSATNAPGHSWNTPPTRPVPGGSHSWDPPANPNDASAWAGTKVRGAPSLGNGAVDLGNGIGGSGYGNDVGGDLGGFSGTKMTGNGNAASALDNFFGSSSGSGNGSGSIANGARGFGGGGDFGNVGRGLGGSGSGFGGGGGSWSAGAASALQGVSPDGAGFAGSSLPDAGISSDDASAYGGSPSTPMAAYGGTVMHRAIVGDPQADGGPNPELVEAAGPIRVTPLRNMPQRRAQASWARFPHYDQGNTTGASDDTFDDADGDDGTADVVPPAPQVFSDATQLPSPSFSDDDDAVPPSMTPPDIHANADSYLQPSAPKSGGGSQNVTTPGYPPPNYLHIPTEGNPVAPLTPEEQENKDRWDDVLQKTRDLEQVDHPSTPLTPMPRAMSNPATDLGVDPDSLLQPKAPSSSSDITDEQENQVRWDDVMRRVSELQQMDRQFTAQLGPVDASHTSSDSPQSSSNTEENHPDATGTEGSGNGLTLDQALKNGNGTLSYEDIQKIHLTDDQSRQIISMFKGADAPWTPDKVRRDADFQPDRFGNSYNKYNEVGRLRGLYPGKSDDDIAALESARRNEERAKYFLFQQLGGADKDRYRMLDALASVAATTALPVSAAGLTASGGIMTAPLATQGAIAPGSPARAPLMKSPPADPALEYYGGFMAKDKSSDIGNNMIKNFRMPADAVSYPVQLEDGSTAHIPVPRLYNPQDVYDAGHLYYGRDLMDPYGIPIPGGYAMNKAVGTYGTYDLQRNGGRGNLGSNGVNTFYPAYTPVSNYNVGLYLGGAGYPLEQAIGLASGYAHRYSSNAGDPKQLEMLKAGWQAAQSMKPSR